MRRLLLMVLLFPRSIHLYPIKVLSRGCLNLGRTIDGWRLDGQFGRFHKRGMMLDTDVGLGRRMDLGRINGRGKLVRAARGLCLDAHVGRRGRVNLLLVHGCGKLVGPTRGLWLDTDVSRRGGLDLVLVDGCREFAQDSVARCRGRGWST